MKRKTIGKKTASGVGLFLRFVFALAAGLAFAYLAWEPSGNAGEKDAMTSASTSQ